MSEVPTRAAAMPGLPAAEPAARGALPRLALVVRRERVFVVFSALFVLFLANFTTLALGSSDAVVQYGFVQRMFGDASHANGYYFGFALLETPFYALGKLLETLGLHSVDGIPTRLVAISLALGLIVLPGIALLVWILRRLSLPDSLTVLVGSVFGTSLFFYAVFQPGKNHVTDALLFVAVIALTLRYFRSAAPSTRLVAALAFVLGFSVTVRYFAGVEVLPLVAMLLWLRRWRDTAIVVVGSAASFLVLALIPKAYGVTIFSGGFYSPENVLVFAPLNPLRMLVTNHRGLFIWSPVTLIALAGWIRVFRTRTEDRRFLGVIAAMGVGILASYAFAPWWDGTYSYSQRYLTPLFPLVAIGLAGAFEARPRLVTGLTAVCVAWSLFLAFNMVTIGGWMFFQERKNSATALAGLPMHDHYSVGSYGWGIYHQSRLVRSWLPWPGSTPQR